MRCIAVVLLGSVALIGCERHPQGGNSGGGAAASEVKRPRPRPEAIRQFLGRWKGPRTCLELYPTGEFQISVLPEGPKVLLLGEAGQRDVGDGVVELTLATKRIERSRWIGKCRKEVVSEAVLDEQDVLGITMTTAAPATLRLTAKSNNEVELCGEQCETLTQATPLLVGQWRDPGMRAPVNPTVSWESGELLEISVTTDRVSLWVAADGADYYAIDSAARTTVLGSGLFRIDLTPARITLRSGSAPPEDRAEVEVLGGSLRKGSARMLTVMRVAGGVEVCGNGDACRELPRFSTIF